MKASECEVLGSYETVVNGQVVTVTRYEPTKLEAISRDHSRLSFHRKDRNRLNNRGHKLERKAI